MSNALPAVGSPAPAIRLPNENGLEVDLTTFVGKTPVVVYFYPKADTPGCTVQACGMRDALASYTQVGVPVFGISPDPVEDVRAFHEKFHLNFPLLADRDGSVCQAYGIWGEKTWQGKVYMGAARTTFIIGRDGKIAQIFSNVKPEGHDQEILGWLKDHPHA